MRALPPLRFRFHEDDRETYGADWFVYDEMALARLRGKDLLEIEAQIDAEFGRSIPAMLGRFRQDYTDAKLALTWAARRMAGVEESLKDYQPMAALIELDDMPGDDVDPPVEGSGSSKSPEPPEASSPKSSPSSPSKRASRRAS